MCTNKHVVLCMQWMSNFEPPAGRTSPLLAASNRNSCVWYLSLPTLLVVLEKGSVCGRFIEHIWLLDGLYMSCSAWKWHTIDLLWNSVYILVQIVHNRNSMDALFLLFVHLSEQTNSGKCKNIVHKYILNVLVHYVLAFSWISLFLEMSKEQNRTSVESVLFKKICSTIQFYLETWYPTVEFLVPRKNVTLCVTCRQNTSYRIVVVLRVEMAMWIYFTLFLFWNLKSIPKSFRWPVFSIFAAGLSVNKLLNCANLSISVPKIGNIPYKFFTAKSIGTWSRIITPFPTIFLSVNCFFHEFSVAAGTFPTC